MDLLGTLSFLVREHPFILLTVLVALAFDFVNGFHDSANAIATVVATKVMTPFQAVLMAGFFNFVGPFLFSLAVANTISSDIVLPSFVTPGMVFAALAGAIVWNLITWHFGLPSSSSHALVGGLVGAALAAAGPAAILLPTWSDVKLVGRYAILGALGGIAAGGVAWLASRKRLPRPAFGPVTVFGALSLGALFVWAKGAPLAAPWQDVSSWIFSVFAVVLAGAVFGAILWVVTQRPMGASLIPGFALFGACVTLVGAALKLKGAHPYVGPLAGASGLTKTVLFMVVSPVLGFFMGFLLASVVSWYGARMEPSRISRQSKRAQLFSSAFYALTHGTNDAQKTMGVIAVLLLSVGAVGLVPGTKNADIPTWVIVGSALAMGLGTMLGGWRIVQTMAARITHLVPAQGFAAETGGGVVLVAMAQAGIPVSTTHAISSSIMGVGATRRASAVRWAVGRRIVGAWVLTIPAAAIVAFVAYEALALVT